MNNLAFNVKLLFHPQYIHYKEIPYYRYLQLYTGRRRFYFLGLQGVRAQDDNHKGRPSVVRDVGTSILDQSVQYYKAVFELFEQGQ